MTPSDRDPSAATASQSAAVRIRDMIGHATHLLPAQGPIEVFVHHNTLHGLEHLPFHDAVARAVEIYAADPYLSERQFRSLLATGRITAADLDAVMSADANDRGTDVWRRHPMLGDRVSLRRRMLRHETYRGDAAQLHWVIAETDALNRFRDDVDPAVRTRCLDHATPADLCDSGTTTQSRYLRALWRVCRQGVSRSRPRLDPIDGGRQRGSLRRRHRLLSQTGIDTDMMVAEVLVPFTAAFLDQGYASRPLPNRSLGFFRCFRLLYQSRSVAGPPWLDRVAKRLRTLEASATSAVQSIQASLAELNVPDAECESFITQSLLALPGWSGMVHQLEHAPGWVDHPAPRRSLEEYLAVRLILDEAAWRFVADQHGLRFEPPADTVDRSGGSTDDDQLQIAFELFQWAQLMGWSPSTLAAVEDFGELILEIRSFDSIARRRTFQEAYERHYHHAVLDAIAAHHRESAEATSAGGDRAETASASNRLSNPTAQSDADDGVSFQICCCIDDREESFRRHLEEIDPDCETFGAAGFFAVAMNYQGVTEASYKPLCPAVVTPMHYVRENAGYTFAGDHRRRSEARRTLGRLTHQVHTGSRSFFGGVLTSILGSLAAFPLVARVLFPRLTAGLRQRATRFLGPPSLTQLQLQRHKDPPGGHDGHIGYTLDEMTAIVKRQLQDIGLTAGFARLIVLTGHGSSSINNPHLSAYNCGACAGKRGGPNARAFAQMANDYRVRLKLSNSGITIPESTWFLGAYHNTCNESVTWYDLDRMPPTHFGLFESTKATVDEATLRNARERCRRFEAAPIRISAADAIRHVQRRSEDLSQVRPEYNHATNALCLVGRRAWSRGLFLDRRSFLTSYDPAIDDQQGTIIARILAAAIPVCAGINLEYYFSTVDNIKYGSGSKLPHNLVSLLGVMEGSSSDLRTGLYQQMIEIHEPMRLMFVIETTQAIMTRIMEDNETIGRLCRGQWVRLALMDPATGQLTLFENGKFLPYQPAGRPLDRVAVSADWFAGHRDHLPPAVVQASGSLPHRQRPADTRRSTPHPVTR